MSKPNHKSTSLWDNSVVKIVRQISFIFAIGFTVAWIYAFNEDWPETTANIPCIGLLLSLIICSFWGCCGVWVADDKPISSLEDKKQFTAIIFWWILHIFYCISTATMSLSFKRTIDTFKEKSQSYYCHTIPPYRLFCNMKCDPGNWHAGKSDMMFLAIGMFGMVLIEVIVILLSVNDIYYYRQIPKWFEKISIYPILGASFFIYIGIINDWGANIKSSGLSSGLMTFISLLTLTYIAKVWDEWYSERTLNDKASTKRKNHTPHHSKRLMTESNAKNTETNKNIHFFHRTRVPTDTGNTRGPSVRKKSH
ncbi:hypothetical protein OZX72_08240 [Bifidobacterium sp. ESL0769]|uniref:hypothetical protein n=1 Tax=Bifidobacterium sp. ESL0769 TaxID=2983229 RepID=UPI0023F6398B|nr:hypothetical protein [Bifidobacterium sp. ESL0769]WEV67213.1 hypothetical protein OZX72_08240 [Bifidobacterium sp. ESL0769]